MAEDVFQATFLQVHLRCDQFEEGRRFRPWLYTVATNQAIDAQRRNKRHRMVSLDNPASGNDDVGTLVQMLAGDGRTAAEVLGIPVGTVKSRLHSAILKLNESWQRTKPPLAEHD